MINDKKEQIRRSAVEVISEHGYYNTSISQIAEQAGVAVGTIYNYFDCKEEILEYIFAMELEKRINFLQKLQNKNLNIWDKVDNFLKMHFSEVQKNIAAAKISIREKEFPRTAYSSSIAEYRSLIPDHIEKLFRDAHKKGEIKDHNMKIMSNLIFGAVQGIVERAIKDNNTSLLKEAPEAIISILREGLSR